MGLETSAADGSINEDCDAEKMLSISSGYGREPPGVEPAA